MKPAKRILVCILTILLVLSYFPAGIYGMPDYEEFDFTLDPTEEKFPNTQSRDDMAWDGDTNTLTLTNFDQGELPSTFVLPDNSTIVLVGDNTIHSGFVTDQAILCEGDLTITGEGTLSIIEAEYGIKAFENLDLVNTEISIYGKQMIRPSESSLSALLYSLVGLYSDMGHIDIQGTTVYIENCTYGVNTGSFRDEKNPPLVDSTQFDITISNSDVSFVMNGIFERTFAISTPVGNINISDSCVDTEGYFSAVVSGLYIDITGSQVDLLGCGLNYEGGSAIYSLERDITVRESQLDIADFTYGVDCGFGIRGSLRELATESLFPEGSIIIEGSDISIIGNGKEEQEYYFPCGVVTLNGDISLTQSEVFVDQVPDGIVAGYFSSGRVIVDTCNVEVNIYDLEVGDGIAAVVNMPIFFEEVPDYHIELKDCYIKAPEGGMVQRYEEMIDPDTVFTHDYIATTEEGQTVISVYPVVSFKSNGGSSVESQVVVPGEIAVEPDDPAKTGYTFEEWFKDDGTFIDQWVFGEDTVTEDITLYAKWAKIPQTVTFVETDEDTDVKAAGLEENINLPEKEDGNVEEITVFVKVEDTGVDASVEANIAGEGYELIGAYNIDLYKRVTTFEGATEEILIDNEDITGPITVWIPLTAEQAEKENLAIAYVDDKGNVEIIQGSVKTVGDTSYFVFETNHFSTYALVELTMVANPATGDQEMESGGTDPVAVYLPIGAMLLVGGIIAGRRKREA